MLPRWLARLATAIVCLAPGPAPPQGARPKPGTQPVLLLPLLLFPAQLLAKPGPPMAQRPGACYQPPPAYMAYPPFKEPGWYYEALEPHLHHRGFHFWLDQF